MIDITNELKAQYMSWDERMMRDKHFRSSECQKVKEFCVEAKGYQNWERACKCYEFLEKWNNKTNDELEIDEVVDGVVLTNEENTANDTLYLTDSDTVDDEPIVVNRTM